MRSATVRKKKLLCNNSNMQHPMARLYLYLQMPDRCAASNDLLFDSRLPQLPVPHAVVLYGSTLELDWLSCDCVLTCYIPREV